VFELNVDYYGFDLAKGMHKASTAEECVPMCADRPECNCFSFIWGHCYLKSSTAGRQVNPKGVGGNCAVPAAAVADSAPAAHEDGPGVAAPPAPLAPQAADHSPSDVPGGPVLVDACELAAAAPASLWTECSSEHSGTPCTCNGYIKYGNADTWTCGIESVGLPVNCGNEYFGYDPLPNKIKQCLCMNYATATAFQEEPAAVGGYAAVNARKSAPLLAENSRDTSSDQSRRALPTRTFRIVGGIVGTAVATLIIFVTIRKRSTGPNHSDLHSGVLHL
jgi:hypothetical protein